MCRRRKSRRHAWPRRAELLARELPLLHALAGLVLRVRAHDSLDPQRRHAGFRADIAVLRLDHGARRLVAIEPAEQLGRDLAVGALRAVFIEDVEQHELAAGARSWFPGPVVVRLSAPAPRGNTRRNRGLQ